MSNREVYYIGGMDSNQRGAVGTHTAGIISGFKTNGYRVIGVFLEGRTAHQKCDSEKLAHPSRSRLTLLSSIWSRVSLARKAKSVAGEKLIYHRFDPLLSPFVTTRNTILEYNDDVVAQIRFAAANGQWSPLGTLIRRLLYPTIFRISERYCFRRASVVVCVTDKLRKFVKSLEPRSNAIFIPNGSSAEFRPELEKKDSPADSILRIAHIGTLTHWDGLIELIEAISIFQKRNKTKNVSLCIVGHGNLHPKVLETIDRFGLQDIVTLIDQVTHQTAIEMLHSVDVVPLLKTIDSYGLSPMKFYEALALGCFLICSDIEHINEVKKDEGYVVPYPFTPNIISNAIEYVYNNRDSIRRSRPVRAKRAQFEHSWHKRVSDILMVIEAAHL